MGGVLRQCLTRFYVKDTSPLPVGMFNPDRIVTELEHGLLTLYPGVPIYSGKRSSPCITNY